MKVTVIGAGYVGLVTALGLYRHGHDVGLLERDAEKARAIGSGRPLIHEPGVPALLSEALASNRFSITTDPGKALVGSELSFICVETPSRDGRIDTGAVFAAAGTITANLGKTDPAHVIVIKSTVLPGTTEKLAATVGAAASGNSASVVACNPEFLREGSALRDFLEPDRIVIGARDDSARDRLFDLYRSFDCPKLAMTPTEAEFVKYASNALLGTLISFSNQIAALGEGFAGVSVEAVFDALLHDQRLSSLREGVRIQPPIVSYLRPGIGFGGSCLPKDITALRAFGQERGIKTTLLDAVLEINEKRAIAVADMAERLVDPLRGASIAVLGIAFKPGTNDLRASPAIACIRALVARGAKIRACDPLVPIAAARAALGGEVEVTEATPNVLRGARLALVASACPEFAKWNWQDALATMATPNILDGRQLFVKGTLPAGATYVAI